MPADAEIEYYRTLYAEHGYGQGRTTRHDVTDAVCRAYGWPGESLPYNWLDAGCGLHVVPVPEGTKLVRADPAAPGVDCALAINELPGAFGSDAFDVVSCFDVLEHVPQDELGACLFDLVFVCRRRLILSVGTDEGQEWAGRSAHLTVQHAGWWLGFLRECFDSVEHVATAKGTSPFFVVDL